MQNECVPEIFLYMGGGWEAYEPFIDEKEKLFAVCDAALKFFKEMHYQDWP